MVENTKHVRVDNWGVFFLQRLQMFFNKTDFCDLTLQFDGNVQLKVHRLVMNACTEYFQILEQTCDVVDDNIILMPPDLQADVILPIVNFMYTGTLEYHPVIYDRLIRTAELMNIPILIKLLEAHKAVPQNNQHAQKRTNIPPPSKQPKRMLNSQAQPKKVPSSLPNTLPGRKLPVWKRKTAPVARSTIVPRDRPVTVPSVDNMGCGATSGVGALAGSYKNHSETVQIDNEPKPTRFEWPDGEDDRIKTETYMDSSAFENLTSYSSSPLIRGEDTEKIPVYDELRYSTTSSSPSHVAVKRRPGQSPYTARRPNQPTQQPAFEEDPDDRSDLDDQQDADDPDYHPDVILRTALSTSGKRAAYHPVTTAGAKRVRFNEKENSSGHQGKELRAGTSKGIVERDSEGHLDHSILVAELLKKYPDLAKTSKNIKLKIMTKPSDKQLASGGRQQISQLRTIPAKVVTQGTKVQPIYKQARLKNVGNVIRKQPKTNTTVRKSETDGPWLCDKCEVPPDPYHLYYLYRKHMTDVHQEQFSPLMCKFCGKRTRSDRALSFHMHTVHGASLSNIIGSPFPQCNRCSFSALSERRLATHKQSHRNSHVQCLQCKVGFTGLHALATHQQITSHISRNSAHANPGMTSYDCQYCTRHWQNSATLFAHLRTAHREDARRDGIVSIDDDPEEEDDEEEDMQQGSEGEEQEQHASADTVMVNKVNVITDVKVTGADDEGTVQMQMTNAGITTTLGLVDIVVLDENQQYILQSSNGALEQSEFILPQITGSFVHQGQQVITTSGGQVHQVISTSTQQDSQQNQQLSTNHINQLKQSTNQSGVGTTSTDELVMVLTDHDYNDETADGNGQSTVDGQHVQSNGNIVVLYSHPVHGGGDVEGQAHVESGGSLLVQTAEGQVLEIRNTHPDLVDHSSQQESIELIQREINNGQSQHILIQQQDDLIEESQEEHLQPHNPDESAEDDYQDEEQQADDLQPHNPEESVEEDYQDGQPKEIEANDPTETEEVGDEEQNGGFHEQEEQQVMLVVAEDEEESVEEASQVAQQLEEEQLAESVDEQDSIVLGTVQEENNEQQDSGQDVCGSQDDVVAHQRLEEQEPEAMEVEDVAEAADVGEISQENTCANDSTEEFNAAESTNTEVTLSYGSNHPHKSPELPLIQEENNEAPKEEEYSEQHTQEIPLDKHTDEHLQSNSEASGAEEAHYSQEAMEVDGAQTLTDEENKEVHTTDELDDSIVEHSQSIEEQLNREEKDTAANSTFEEDDNEDNDVMQGATHITGEDDLNQEEAVIEEGRDVVQEAADENEGEGQSTDKNDDEEHVNGEVMSKENSEHAETEEDPSLNLDSDQIERAMETLHSNEEPTSMNPSFTNISNSKSAPQNSTIALLDEWEDTEDSSSQDKNCPAPVKTTSMTSAVNKLINDDWDDDE